MEARDWYTEKRVERTLKALRDNGFEALYFPSGDEAVDKVLEMIPEGSLVGLGGSVTLRELEIPLILEERGYRVADHWAARQRGAGAGEVMEIRRSQVNSDVFITSCNAVTESGELVNLDGGGQRVAASIFGPGHVIVVAGVNKLAMDLEEGIWRTRNVAAPINARRLGRATPCAETGVCTDCDSPERICSALTILYRRTSLTPVTVILVGEKLGY